jgi:hypothetical protein
MAARPQRLHSANPVSDAGTVSQHVSMAPGSLAVLLAANKLPCAVANDYKHWSIALNSHTLAPEWHARLEWRNKH